MTSPSTHRAEDILVVGAGPAGATTCLFLAQEQIPHTLIDREIFPRDKVDGNVYGVKVVEVMEHLSPDYFPELADQAKKVLGCNSAQVFTPNGGQFNVGFSARSSSNGIKAENEHYRANFPLFTINRRFFDNFLVSKLDPRYSSALWGTELEGIQRHQDRWQVSVRSKDGQRLLTPKLIIAADGVNSTVLKLLGVQPSRARYYDSVQGYFRRVAGFELEERSPDQPAPQHIEGHFLPESNPGFFFISPLAGGVFNVGMVKPRREGQQTDLSQLLQNLIQHHFGDRFADAEVIREPLPWDIVVGTLGRPPVSGDGYLVTGDAAGLCNPLTCFGTGNAMISGMLAAEQIKRSLSQNQYNRNSLQTYDQELYSKLQPEFRYSNIVKAFARQKFLFNSLGNHQVKSLLRQALKKTSATMKRV
ncbi:MAG: NAD(P)/FAD-dependent oxidoreductase [Cyanobacteria bacterium J06621_8]